MRKLICSLAMLWLASTAQADPNIVLIIADDLTPAAVSAYGTGGDGINEHASTPNIDAIATAGVKLTNAYHVTPICTPARQQIYTGQGPWRTGVYGNDDALADTTPTVADVLAAAGYDTAILGKWQTLPMEDPGANLGWDYRATCFVEGCSANHVSNRFCIDEDGGSGANCADSSEYALPLGCTIGVDCTGQKSFPDNSANITDLLTDMAKVYMNARDADPFFLVIAHKAPHLPIIAAPAEIDDESATTFNVPATIEGPLTARADHVQNWTDTLLSLYTTWTTGNYAGAYGKEQPDGSVVTDAQKRAFVYQAAARDYTESTSSLDRNVGAIRSYLSTTLCTATDNCTEGQPLASNTILIFISDNGMMTGEFGRYGKYRINDVSDKMVFVAEPASLLGVSPGTTHSEFVYNIDLTSTLVALAGETPSSAMPTAQGRSLTELFAGSPSPAWRTGVYFHATPVESNQVNQRHIGYITADWKLVRHINKTGTAGPEWELIDRDADPNELTNVYLTEGAAVKAMKAAMRAEMTALGIGGYMEMNGGTRASGAL